MRKTRHQMRRYTELCWDGSPGDEGRLGVQGFLITAGPAAVGRQGEIFSPEGNEEDWRVSKREDPHADSWEEKQELA